MPKACTLPTAVIESSERLVKSRPDRTKGARGTPKSALAIRVAPPPESGRSGLAAKAYRGREKLCHGTCASPLPLLIFEFPLSKNVDSDVLAPNHRTPTATRITVAAFFCCESDHCLSTGSPSIDATGSPPQPYLTDVGNRSTRWW